MARDVPSLAIASTAKYSETGPTHLAFCDFISAHTLSHIAGQCKIFADTIQGMLLVSAGKRRLKGTIQILQFQNIIIHMNLGIRCGGGITPHSPQALTLDLSDAISSSGPGCLRCSPRVEVCRPSILERRWLMLSPRPNRESAGRSAGLRK